MSTSPGFWSCAALRRLNNRASQWHCTKMIIISYTHTKCIHSFACMVINNRKNSNTESYPISCVNSSEWGWTPVDRILKHSKTFTFQAEIVYTEWCVDLFLMKIHIKRYSIKLWAVTVEWCRSGNVKPPQWVVKLCTCSVAADHRTTCMFHKRHE
jgi:hypothetical protein